MTRIYTLKVKFDDDEKEFSDISVVESSVTPEPQLGDWSNAFLFQQTLENNMFNEVLEAGPENV